MAGCLLGRDRLERDVDEDEDIDGKWGCFVLFFEFAREQWSNISTALPCPENPPTRTTQEQQGVTENTQGKMMPNDRF